MYNDVEKAELVKTKMLAEAYFKTVFLHKDEREREVELGKLKKKIPGNLSPRKNVNIMVGQEKVNIPKKELVHFLQYIEAKNTFSNFLATPVASFNDLISFSKNLVSSGFTPLYEMKTECYEQATILREVVQSEENVGENWISNEECLSKANGIRELIRRECF